MWAALPGTVTGTSKARWAGGQGLQEAGPLGALQAGASHGHAEKWSGLCWGGGRVKQAGGGSCGGFKASEGSRSRGGPALGVFTGAPGS